MGSVLPWLGEAVVPRFVSNIELMVRGLSVVVGFTTFHASLELLLREGESHSQVILSSNSGSRQSNAVSKRVKFRVQPDTHRR